MRSRARSARPALLLLSVNCAVTPHRAEKCWPPCRRWPHDTHRAPHGC